MPGGLSGRLCPCCRRCRCRKGGRRPHFPRSLRPAGGSHPWFEPVSWQPRAFVAHNFASQEETDHVIKLAQPLVCCALWLNGPRGSSRHAWHIPAVMGCSVACLQWDGAACIPHAESRVISVYGWHHNRSRRACERAVP